MNVLDLFCGAGGASEGYRRAGFEEIVGVDIAPQPNYPFEFIEGDWASVLFNDSWIVGAARRALHHPRLAAVPTILGYDAP